MKYLSIDIETTGLDPEKHQILEFALFMMILNSQLNCCRNLLEKSNGLIM